MNSFSGNYSVNYSGDLTKFLFVNRDQPWTSSTGTIHCLCFTFTFL